MISSRPPNLVLGWCFSAIAIATISGLSWVYKTYESPESVQNVCESAISIEKAGLVRLGCASELDTEVPNGVQAGDHVKWDAGRYEVVVGGMESHFRLAALLPLQLNRVTEKDLQILQGVGPVLAGAVVAYREFHGPFETLDALLNVRGIGPKVLEHLSAYLTVGLNQSAGGNRQPMKE